MRHQQQATTRKPTETQKPHLEQKAPKTKHDSINDVRKHLEKAQKEQKNIKNTKNNNKNSKHTERAVVVVVAVEWLVVSS